MSESSRVRNAYDRKKKKKCDDALRVAEPKKLLVVWILGEKTNVWEDGEALSPMDPTDYLFLEIYLQKYTLSV